MKFIDEAVIIVQSGDGGNGCISFRREKFIARGGPDGGDGGKGGDVILKATHRKRTLHDFQFNKQFKAKNGGHGQGQQKTGKNGASITIHVPPGTLVIDTNSGHLIKDLVKAGESLTVAQGGKGGRGNTRFKGPTNRTPRYAQPGQAGETLTLKLELKLLADVGIIGLPNAGKSTLISSISSAKPKIGSYPFTTLSPNLGVVQTRWSEPFIVADIPGLIRGAHSGAGLGTKFLRHIERTRLLVHLIDITTISPDNPLESYQAINSELACYNKGLLEKPQIVVLNKMDLADSQEAAALFNRHFCHQEVALISARTGQGTEQLVSRILAELDAIDESN